MEQLPDGAHVRLRSRVHGGYLHADEDGMGLSLRRWRSRKMNAAWKVHRILQDGSTSVLLHSAAYGRYLAATNDAAPPDHIDLLVGLGEYDQVDADPISWNVVGSGDAGYVLLRTVKNRLPRANGRFRLWLGGVTVDDVDNQSTMMHWKVETIPTSPNPPALRRTPPPNHRRSFRGLFLLHEEPVQPQRTIRVVRADNYGSFADDWGTFQFQGRSVFELRAEVARRMGNAFLFFRILMCVQGGRYGRLTPLLVDLPRNEETVDIIVPVVGTEVTQGGCHGRLIPLLADLHRNKETVDIVGTKVTQGGGYGWLTPLLVDLPRNEETVDIISLIIRTEGFTPNIWTTSQGRLVMNPSDRMPLHGLPSRVAEEQILNMRVILILVGDQYFMDVFENCLQPILGVVVQQNSFEEFLGNPMHQTVPSTCAIVSSAKCVEMQHRREYETRHGLGKFPCQAASPRKLRRICRRKQIWTASGAYVGDVMEQIRLVGGIITTNAPPPAPHRLPLLSWEKHTSDDLTADRVVELLDSRGPFVGTFWVCPWYTLFDADEDENLVYRSGCARNQLMQDWSESCFNQYKVPVGLHSVVCFEYRVIDGELHVLVLDNNTPTGPKRWIHYMELQEVHTVRVERLDLDGRTPVYPKSKYM